MKKAADKGLGFCFYLLFFAVPLLVWPYTSELFEFNKMVAVYALTASVAFFWALRMVADKRIIFRRTILDIPLLIYLSTQLLASLASIDPRTSFLGYYSRFHGGFLSLLCYSLLYWAYVSNFSSKDSLKHVKALVFSAAVVSGYAILQHFGIDENVWVQDVKRRVFSTFGQPNWLATWIAAIIPLAWVIYLKDNTKKSWVWIFFASVFYLVLLYTRSRSGFLGFAAAFFIFWGVSTTRAIAQNKNQKKIFFRKLAVSSILIVLLSALSSTPFSPSVTDIFKNKTALPESSQITGPALEAGGTDSGEIRKIVWRGALEVFKHYPLLGTGVETFAFSYYLFRPAEHNMVSEWDFLYNKAHNEYLNILSNTGLVGFAGYLLYAGTVLYFFAKSAKSSFSEKSKKAAFTFENTLSSGLLSGYCAVLVSNFFGFSVVAVSLLMFLFPAFLSVWENGAKEGKEKPIRDVLSGGQKAAVLGIFLVFLFLLSRILLYYRADTLYAKGKAENDRGNHLNAGKLLARAVEISPKEPFFHDELAKASVNTALSLSKSAQSQAVQQYIDLAIESSDKAVSLSKANVNLLRNRANHFIKLATVSPVYLIEAKSAFEKAVEKAPTDAKLRYNLALTYLRLEIHGEARTKAEETIRLKPDYRDARLLYAIILKEEGRAQEAREELLYILEFISPDDPLVLSELE